MKKIKLDYVLNKIFDDYKILDTNYYNKLKNWVVEEFNEWHKEAFKKSPIVQYDHKSNEFIMLKGSGGY